MRRTLSYWRVIYSNAPRMTAAIDWAIIENGPGAAAVVVSGTPSYDKRSNCYKAAKGRDYIVYPGTRRRSFINVLVLL